MDGYCLLLNGSYTPISVIRMSKAIVLVLTDKAEVLEESEITFHSESRSVRAPSVVRLVYTVKIPIRTRLPVTRRNVLARDHGKCAYRGQPRPARAPQCLGHGSTIDHVHPRAKGGTHRWENVTAACLPCNGYKDNKTLDQLGWQIDRTKLTVPTRSFWAGIGITQPAEWEPYLRTA